MVDLGQKKANASLPFFMLQTLGVASNKGHFSLSKCYCEPFSFPMSLVCPPMTKSLGWRAPKILIVTSESCESRLSLFPRHFLLFFALTLRCGEYPEFEYRFPNNMRAISLLPQDNNTSLYF